MKALTLSRPLRVPFKIDRKYIWSVAVIVVVYFVAAKLGLLFAFSAKQVSAVWPGTGLPLLAWSVSQCYVGQCDRPRAVPDGAGNRRR
jgi:integral membrane sensor domain MASE1